jgi:peptidoglycan-N-acetylglucosamine deacetylase
VELTPQNQLAPLWQWKKFVLHPGAGREKEISLFSGGMCQLFPKPPLMIRNSICATVLMCLAACTGQSQTASEPAGRPLPTVVVVPPDELSREPSLSPATNRPAVPKPTTVQQENTPASLPKPAAPTAAPRKHSHNNVKTVGNQIAMTFDDGPHPQLTPKLLDLLKDRGIRATFYVIGANVEKYPEIVKRMVAEGHEVGNHTWNHPSLTKLSTARVKSEMDRTTRAITDASGITPVTMRPPYGATNTALNRRMHEEFGLPVIMWSVDPRDWRYRNSSRVASHIIENTKSGDIVLAHDIHPTTVAAMPRTLDALKARGFQFVTVSELLALDGQVEVASVATPEP